MQDLRGPQDIQISLAAKDAKDAAKGRAVLAA